MFDSKSPIVKVVGYTIIGFFAMIIIISFGMPDFLSKMGRDNSIIAIVNGQKIPRIDFLRYRDRRFGNIRDEKMESFILNYYINDILLLQKAQKAGFTVSDDRISWLIQKDIPAFKNPETGKFDPELYKRIREINHLNNSGFYESIRKDLIKSDFIQFLKMGTAVSRDDIFDEYHNSNSKIQIKYAYISNMDLKKRYGNDIAVSDVEINAEMEKNKGEVKDPTSDRERIKRNLENKKFDKAKNDLINRINTVALKNGFFTESAALLNGKVELSNIFKIGEELKEAGPKGTALTAVSNSPIFIEDCLKISSGSSSRVIESGGGLYIFTPVLKNIKKDTPLEKDYADIEKRLADQYFSTITGNFSKEINEKSEIQKNIKTD